MESSKYILGLLSIANHDQGACVLKVDPDGGFDYVAIAEERLSREKYSFKFPYFSIDYCLKHFGLESLDQIDVLATDYIRLKRWNLSGPGYNVSEHDYLKKILAIPREKVFIVNHHMSHAAVAYYLSGFDDAAILTADGNGSELETQGFFKGQGNELTEIDKYHFHGIGYCYSAVTRNILNFGTGGEGKTMGLAPYGEKHPPVLGIKGSYDGIKTNYSSFLRRLPKSDVMNQMDPANALYPFREEFKKRGNAEDPLDPYFSRVAFEIQEETQEVLVHLANELYSRHPSKNICLCGGVMLNCVTNRLILDESPFEDIFIFPGCSDTGIPVGNCLLAYHNHPLFKKTPKTRQVMKTAYLGREYSDSEVAETLDRYKVPSEKTDPKEVAALLADRKVVAWFQGGSEFGPRALGHRSIMADSRDSAIKDRVNDEVKHRELFRPFAPVVLEEKCSEQFDLERPSPFMLLVGDALRPEEIPSVIHVDDSARIQTVNLADNEGYYEVVREFDKITGIPVLMNTSFNVAGEPIVETPRDALICALGTDMDYLVLHDRLVDCKCPGHKEICAKMVEDREEEIAKWREEVINKYFPGYDEAERDAFIKNGNEQAYWWTKHRAKYELEKAVLDWMSMGTKIAIVGEAQHTAYLREYVNEFICLDVAGFLDIDNPGPAEGLPYQPLTWDDLKDSQADVVLFASWEHQYDLADKVEDMDLDMEPYLIYDLMGRSLEDLYPAPKAK